MQEFQPASTMVHVACLSCTILQVSGIFARLKSLTVVVRLLEYPLGIVRAIGFILALSAFTVFRNVLYSYTFFIMLKLSETVWLREACEMVPSSPLLITSTTNLVSTDSFILHAMASKCCQSPPGTLRRFRYKQCSDV